MNSNYKVHCIKVSPLHFVSPQLSWKALTCPSAFLWQPQLHWDGNPHSAQVPAGEAQTCHCPSHVLRDKHLSLYQSYPKSLNRHRKNQSLGSMLILRQLFSQCIGDVHCKTTL